MKILTVIRLASLCVVLAFVAGCTANQINNPELQYALPSNYTGDPDKNDLYD